MFKDRQLASRDLTRGLHPPSREIVYFTVEPLEPLKAQSKACRPLQQVPITPQHAKPWNENPQAPCPASYVKSEDLAGDSPEFLKDRDPRSPQCLNKSPSLNFFDEAVGTGRLLPTARRDLLGDTLGLRISGFPFRQTVSVFGAFGSKPVMFLGCFGFRGSGFRARAWLLAVTRLSALIIWSVTACSVGVPVSVED